MKVEELKAQLAAAEAAFKNNPTEEGFHEVEGLTHDIEMILGRERCPKCAEWTVRVRSIPTLQYGGGYDTTYVCENPTCDYKDVAV